MIRQSFSSLRTLLCASLFLGCGTLFANPVPNQDVTAPNDDAPEFTAKGRSELGFQGSYLIIDPDGEESVDFLSGNLDYSYFIVDNWALRPQYQLIRHSNDTSLTAHILGLGVDFHIPHENLAFFVGAAPNVGFVSNGDSDTELFVEVRGGIKHYLSRKLALNTQLSYSWGSDYSVTRVSLGLAVLFGGD